jgi:hypothetical protein
MARLTSRLAVTALAAVGFARVTTAQSLTAIRAGWLVDVDRGEVRRNQLLLLRGCRRAARWC